MAEEGLKTTRNKLIHIGCPIPFDMDEFVVHLKELLKISYKNDESIRNYVQKVVETYQLGGMLLHLEKGRRDETRCKTT